MTKAVLFVHRSNMFLYSPPKKKIHPSSIYNLLFGFDYILVCDLECGCQCTCLFFLIKYFADVIFIFFLLFICKTNMERIHILGLSEDQIGSNEKTTILKNFVLKSFLAFRFFLRIFFFLNTIIINSL